MKLFVLILLAVLISSCQSKIPCSKDLTRSLSECISYAKPRPVSVCEVEYKTDWGMSCITREELRAMMEQF